MFPRKTVKDFNAWVRIIRVDGQEFALIDPGNTDLDYLHRATLQSSYEYSLRNHKGHVLIDLSKTEYLDSAGLGMLLGMTKELGAQARELVLLVGDNDVPTNILALTRLEKIFNVAKDYEEAIHMYLKPDPAA